VCVYAYVIVCALCVFKVACERTRFGPRVCVNLYARLDVGWYCLLHSLNIFPQYSTLYIENSLKCPHSPHMQYIFNILPHTCNVFSIHYPTHAIYVQSTSQKKEICYISTSIVLFGWARQFRPRRRAPWIAVDFVWHTAAPGWACCASPPRIIRVGPDAGGQKKGDPMGVYPP